MALDRDGARARAHRRREALRLLTGRALYRKRGDACVAADLLRRALALDPSDFDARLDLARCEARAGETALALGSPAAALEGRPDAVSRIRWHELRVQPSAARVWAWLRALASTPPPALNAPRVRLARANSAPERRGIKDRCGCGESFRV